MKFSLEELLEKKRIEGRYSSFDENCCTRIYNMLFLRTVSLVENKIKEKELYDPSKILAELININDQFQDKNPKTYEELKSGIDEHLNEIFKYMNKKGMKFSLDPIELEKYNPN